MKGVYALVISIPDNIELQIGALGRLRFEAGEWVYVGSAFGNGSTSLEYRIRRHFSSEKKIHWHIDLFLHAVGPPADVIWSLTRKKRECEIAARLRSQSQFSLGPPGFGSSDCKEECGTHLFRHNAKNVLKDLKQVFRELKLEPRSMEGLPRD